MLFWIFMFVCDLLCPLIMLIAGAFMRRGGTKTINHWCGYRTELSMKNKDTWVFAHKHCGALWLKLGAVMLPLTVIAFLLLLGKGEMPIAIAGLAIAFVQMLVFIASIFPTERALRKTFDQNGNRKEKTE